MMGAVAVFFWTEALLAFLTGVRFTADFVTAFLAALTGALTAAVFLAGAFFAAFLAGADFAALTAAQRFFCASAMRFLAAGLNLRRLGDFPAGASFPDFSAGAVFAPLALMAAQRFFCASAMRLRAAGLTFLRLTDSWAGVAFSVAAVAASEPESSARACRSLPISSSIAAIIKPSSILPSQAENSNPETRYHVDSSLVVGKSVMPQFERYIGVDYSGAETPDSSCKGIRVYKAEVAGEPQPVQPPPSPRRYWTRRGLAEWLCEELGRDIPTLVGIDHAFSFPLAYFERYRLSSNWQSFLEDFRHHWPTDSRNTYVCFIRDDKTGQGRKRTGERSWLRITEQWTPAAKSVFGFGVQGEVATSTHAGLPWLLYLRKECRRSIHFWPFDGWEIPLGKSVVAEVYPSLWTRRFPKDGRDGDEQAAYAAAAWLQRADRTGSLNTFFHPPLTAEELGIARIEGWILGVA